MSDLPDCTPASIAAQHSPLPWECAGVFVVALPHGSERLVARAYYNGELPFAEAKANAAFINRACNNHYTLLTACKLAMDAFERHHCIDWSEIERAIAKAEKG